MARATRSTAQADKDTKPQDTAPATRKGGNKKRKRNTNSENGDAVEGGDQPAVKQARTGSRPQSEEQLPVDGETKEVEPRGSGDVPIDQSDAQKILDVLEMIDTQGLLDRVFPLPNELPEANPPDSSSTPSSSVQTYSFRALLKNSSGYPLKVLRSAVQHLFPISSHPRSRPSAPAAQQLRFCNLALSLLDLASFHSVPTPLDAQSVFPSLFEDPPPDAEDAKPPKPDAAPQPPEPHKRRYALVQHLPTGDWWTSLNSDTAPTVSEGKGPTDLPIGHAELAIILPTASTSTLITQKTLGEYVTRRTFQPMQPLPAPRRVSCGKFLDYGPYASFAPSFDQDGTEAGRDALGEVIWQQRQKALIREKIKGKQKALSAAPVAGDGDVDMLPALTETGGDGDEWEAALESLVSPEEASAIKAAMGSLELEQAVQELLDRNARALVRLQRLQRERLGTDVGGSSTVQEGSEEWETAQAIIDSLAVLASLRPRSSSDNQDNSPFIPPTSVLRTLQRTLPIDATRGWYGTLPASRTTALRDDNTVQAKAGATAPTTTAAIAAPTTTAATAKPQATASPYAPYSYGNYTSQYRGPYGSYGQTGGYYGYAAGQTTGNGGYPSTPYGVGTSGYQYGPFYNYSPPVANAQAQTQMGATGGSTPQSATTPSTVASNYATFFATTAQQPQPQRAVANTVLTAAAKPYQPAAWQGGQQNTNYVAPTLPPHLRAAATTTPTAGGASTPGTPQPATPGTTATTYSSFYSTYQPTTPAAR
ncbi:hypothetical protein WOLCODRAFT_111555 [Wolfiporia cocos MD-104 SS10]|uniref:Uncharacterized protein n=1 Tax=Wolfiporia cocos (strain MD-104) TaxID=742152 RepID=A0A2H3IU80_WOLCO|nr:hypothetical protein WOLCODRAFT_111555 [Wolfiporia cocos MD-104 SS10]